MNVFERMALALEAAGVSVDRTNHLNVVAQGAEMIEKFNALGLEFVDDDRPDLEKQVEQTELVMDATREEPAPSQPSVLEKALDNMAPKRAKSQGKRPAKK